VARNIRCGAGTFWSKLLCHMRVDLCLAKLARHGLRPPTRPSRYKPFANRSNSSAFFGQADNHLE
jgi:hypothetical protein